MTGMTTTTHRTVFAPTIDPGPLAPDDPRLLLAKTVALGGAVIARVEADQFGLPTPCDDFDVRSLLGHMVGALQRVAVVGRGDDPFTAPFVLEGVADDGWPVAWAAAAHQVQDVWADDTVLERSLQLPWTTMSGAQALGIYTSELSVHTWDLAVATGLDPVWDQGVLVFALGVMTQQLPADMRGEGIPFAPVVPVTDDAPVIDRLVAWCGRQPRPRRRVSE
jgi:uncharacterized protein (TIGR03086 family)